MISVVIPVGPRASHKKWLESAINSIIPQLQGEDEIILIDDMADLEKYTYERCKIWRAPWRLGCADGWNIGISIAKNNLCLMMASDDWLEPNCLETLRQTWMGIKNPLGYYSLTIKYVAEPGCTFNWAPIQSMPCNAAMVHKELWKHTGGFPPEAGIGAPDAGFISVLLKHGADAGYLYRVKEGTPLYNVRVHPDQETGFTGSYWTEIISVRDKLTKNWVSANWGRYIP